MNFSGTITPIGQDSEVYTTGAWQRAFLLYFLCFGAYMKIITNNPLVNQDDFQMDVKFINTDYLGILNRAKDMIHAGYQILTHPLYGSVKPDQTMYRTLILKKTNTTDFDSVIMIEDAIEVSKHFVERKRLVEYNEETLEDFQIIDRDLVLNARKRIP